jgi:hypothetical protein
MKRQLIHWAAGTAAALASAGALAGTATVTFVHPENYQDMPRYQQDRQDLLKDLADHIIYLAGKLPPDRDLKIEVLDLNMAGRMIPSFRTATGELRVLRGGADWPTMRIRYTLSAGGAVLASGEDRMSDMSYFDRINRYDSGDPLRYEKQMVDDWFKAHAMVAAR